jgi:TPR repeat protein
MLPPSQHKTIAGLLLQGCAENEEPLAVKHILTAVYLNNWTLETGARDIALLFPRSEIPKYQKTLEKLASKDDPEAMTLQGLFAERDGQPAKARALYEKALQIKWVFQYVAGSRHPAQLPIIAPWNALGYLLKTDKDPATRAQAKLAFEQGANKGDDPLSYYELAAFQDRSSVEWLRSISKAAASGHREAMVELANFYRDVNSKDSPLLQSSQLRKALNWLLNWRQNSAEQLAIEWFEAAGIAGHKAAMLQLADLYEASGDREKARATLQRIVEPATDARAIEEFPQIVHQAKGRLSGIRTV